MIDRLKTKSEKDAFYAGRAAWTKTGILEYENHYPPGPDHEAFKLGWKQKQEDFDEEGGDDDDSEDE